ncbi:MAG: hypothetical protein ACTHOF_06040, partial [Flavisolibacter sp.]
RAYFYFNLTKDSGYIKKFLRKGHTLPVKKDSSAPQTKIVYRKPDLFEPEKNSLFKKKNATI